MATEDNGLIDDLNKSLYSRSAPDIRTRRTLRYTENTSKIPTAWESTEDKDFPDPVLNDKFKDNSMSIFTKILIGSGIFCLLSVGIGAFIFFTGASLISADNIDITISGPASVSGGDPISLDVRVLNKNNIDLTLVDMLVSFPAGTTEVDNPTKELKEYKSLLGDIAANEVSRTTVDAILFGEENTKRQINITLTYGVKGATSVFTKTKSYDVLISSSPVRLTVSSFKEVISGQEFDIKVSLKSNSQQVLRNILIKGQYPSGFSFISSNPPSIVGDNSTWNIGDLAPGTERTIVIRGKLQGEDNEPKVFRFTTGARSSVSNTTIGTEFGSFAQDILIQKPFISLGIQIEGDNSTLNYSTQYDQPTRVEVVWFNNLSVPISNAEITLKLSGNAYDRNSVSPDTGFYKSVTDEIVWNQQNTRELASIGPGGSGKVAFSIVPRNIDGNNLVINPRIDMTVNVSGNRTQESQVSNHINVATNRSILINSQVFISGRILRSVGPFTNTGPIPPRADTTSSYTVLWSVDNTVNNITGAQVVATLPSYVKWLGQVKPDGESLTYDQNAGVITWNIGNVNTHTIRTSRRREVYFQISIEPSINQVGSSPVLVNSATLRARDTFTGINIEDTQDPLNTRFSTDPNYLEGQGIVTK